ncbi:MAG: hypothetical protein Greene041619_853 [Candidatus Peregrinibacteria bacterium Greene0416_19]|nr:MAG: hypothetical protein Greene041619_853 [Candidatus Peregrinibacteria bacterium Greene0416_19]
MPPRTALAAAAMLTTLWTGFALAQDSSPSSSSSSSSSSSVEDPLLRSFREKRTEGFREKLAAAEKFDRNWQATLRRYLDRQTTYRRECRSNLRKANRDVRMAILLRCFRGTASDKRELIRKQIQYIEQIPGVTELIRRYAIERLQSLTEALTAIMSGVDGGVFETQDQVLEARKNLLERYQMKAWDMITLVRADRALTWVSLLLLDVDTARESETTSVGSERPEWQPVRTCLRTAEQKLQTFIQEPPDKHSVALPAILTELEPCVQQLQAIEPLPEAGSSSTSSASSL